MITVALVFIACVLWSTLVEVNDELTQARRERDQAHARASHRDDWPRPWS